MKILIQTTMVLGMLLMAAFPGQAQEADSALAAQHLERLMQLFGEESSYEARLSLSLYERNANEPFRQLESHIRKDGAQLWTKQNQQEMLMNKALVIQLDRSMEVLQLSERTRDNKQATGGFEAYLELYQKATATHEGSSDVLRLDFVDELLYDYAEIWLDPATSAPSRMVLWSKPDPQNERARMELQYEQLDLQPEFDAAAFASNRYVQKNRGQYAPAAAYRNYQFIDPFTE